MTKLFLHLGTHKTGTSSVQRALRINAENLASMGVRAVFGAESNPFLDEIDHDTVRNDWIAGSHDVIVFSNENFILVDNLERLKRVRALRDTAVDAGGQVTMVFYIRPAIEWIPSMWAQYVKLAHLIFGKMTLDEFIGEFPYELVLDAVANFRSEGDTIVRPYVRDAMGPDRMFDDFFTTIGVDTGGLAHDTTTATINSTPSRRQIELARAYNVHRPPGRAAREHHLKLLNSFLRARNYRDATPSVARTVTKHQLQRIADRYATREAELTEGAVDSKQLLAGHLAQAPTDYVPHVRGDAIDLYFQHMAILSTIEERTAHDEADTA